MHLNFLRKIKRNVKISLRRSKLKSLAQNGNVKIVVGAGSVSEPGWIPTEIDFLNMLLDSDWAYYFKEGSIDAILGEHVWEHLTYADGLAAAKFCYKYLKQGAYLRVAVPDGNHPDPNYIEHVKPGGTGDGADDHKLLYTADLFKKLFEEAGFQVRLLEWFDNDGQFHYEDWKKEDGMIWRSRRFDERNKDGKLNYTSLIVDAIK